MPLNMFILLFPESWTNLPFLKFLSLPLNQSGDGRDKVKVGYGAVGA